MELFLQYGHGMKAHSEDLTKSWNGGSVIFSPKNMTLDQMLTASARINNDSGNIYLDPQFYVPRANSGNLSEHSFWPQNYDTNSFFNGNGISSMIDSLVDEYLIPINATGFIIPSFYLASLDDDWGHLTDSFIDVSLKKNFSGETYLTLCIDEKVLNSEEAVDDLVERIEDYPVDGFYIIPKHPNNDYLVSDVSWMLNLIDLCAAIKLLGKKVFVGYSGHQFLLLSLAKVDAICAGTWLKTRNFPLTDFDDSEEQNFARRTTWYYCPQALSEYQINYLDIAFRLGILGDLKSPAKYESWYSDILFGGAQPTTTNFRETEAFRHYLHCLKKQCEESTKSTYDATRDYLKMLFETADDLTHFFKQNGIRGKGRDFSEVAESNLSIIDAFDNLRGLVYKTSWSQL
ncbi:MAG: hypothetical protein PF693_12510 [Spirochaetia bacterium]|jgi:hypothetical protein|nr:hypothetical protein [Spirochaetia bacterium]